MLVATRQKSQTLTLSFVMCQGTWVQMKQQRLVRDHDWGQKIHFNLSNRFHFYESQSIIASESFS